MNTQTPIRMQIEDLDALRAEVEAIYGKLMMLNRTGYSTRQDNRETLAAIGHTGYMAALDYSAAVLDAQREARIAGNPSLSLAAADEAFSIAQREARTAGKPYVYDHRVYSAALDIVTAFMDADGADERNDKHHQRIKDNLKKEINDTYEAMKAHPEKFARSADEFKSFWGHNHGA